MTTEPTCREVVELITDYLEGTMPTDLRQTFEQHLDGCEGCRDYVEQMRAAIALSRSRDDDALPPDVQERLVEAFRGFRRV